MDEKLDHLLGVVSQQDASSGGEIVFLPRGAEQQSVLAAGCKEMAGRQVARFLAARGREWHVQTR